MPDFPDVPQVLGVPPLLVNPLAPVSLPTLIFSDGAILPFGLFGRWGIFFGAAPVVTPDTMSTFEFRREYAIADYPVETSPQQPASFESYDKVEVPFLIRAQLASGGSEANRTLLLDQVTAIASTLQLYNVVTPEQIYLNCNVQRFDYRRTAINGAGMIIVDLWLLQVRLATPNGFTPNTSAGNAPPQNAKSPSGQPQVNGGNVAPTATWKPTEGAVQYLQQYPHQGRPRGEDSPNIVVQ